jgi:hypothetical protein
MTTFEIPTLNTGRLRLRAFQASDLDAYAAMQANGSDALPGNGPHVYPSRSLADDGHVSWGLGFARLRYVGLRKN